jgi:hypothetical protein
MATQDDIDNLTNQINAEQQSAELLEKDIAKEQQNSAQKISGLQERARRHHDTAAHMMQTLEAKQKELIREQQDAAADEHAKEKARHNAEMIARRLI